MKHKYFLMCFDDGKDPMLLVRIDSPIGEESFIKYTAKTYHAAQIIRLNPGEIVWPKAKN